MYLYLLLATGAIWRLTYDFLNLDGPLGLYGKVRHFVEARRETWPAWVVDGISCYHCLSFWAGFAVCLLIPGLTWREYFLASVGASGLVTFIARYCKAVYGADLFD